MSAEDQPIPEASPFGYLCFLPRIVKVAEEMGYCLAVHGSLKRDFDIVAVPWIEECYSPEDLVEGIRAACGGWLTKTKEGRYMVADKPHGRRAWKIHLGSGPYIDLSVMPPYTYA